MKHADERIQRVPARATYPKFFEPLAKLTIVLKSVTLAPCGRTFIRQPKLPRKALIFT